MAFSLDTATAFYSVGHEDQLDAQIAEFVLDDEERNRIGMLIWDGAIMREQLTGESIQDYWPFSFPFKDSKWIIEGALQAVIEKAQDL